MDYIIYIAAAALVIWWIVSRIIGESGPVHRNDGTGTINIRTECEWMDQVREAISQGEVIRIQSDAPFHDRHRIELDKFTQRMFDELGELFVPQGELRVGPTYLDKSRGLLPDGFLMIGESKTDQFCFAVSRCDPKVVSFHINKRVCSKGDEYSNIAELIVDYAKETE